MKQITMYQANDGEVFDSKQECIQYENKQKIIEKLSNELYLREVDVDELYEWICKNVGLFLEEDKVIVPESYEDECDVY
jgi:hypothetical protein